MPTTAEQVLAVPDRFERLRSVGDGTLRGIILPISEALESLDNRFDDMVSADRGSLMILRGKSGAGKSTFLDTVGLFRQGVRTFRIAPDEEIAESLAKLGESDGPQIAVLEGREALRDISNAQLEAWLHAANSFLRTDAGSRTLIVWPTNRKDLTVRLTELGAELGGAALFGLGDPVVRFAGPKPNDYIRIAERTVAALNQGASLASLGITNERAVELLEDAGTVGDYLACRFHGLLGVDHEKGAPDQGEWILLRDLFNQAKEHLSGEEDYRCVSRCPPRRH